MQMTICQICGLQERHPLLHNQRDRCCTCPQEMANLRSRLQQLAGTAYRLGISLRDYEQDHDDVIAKGSQLVEASGICEHCDGTGQDCDPDGVTTCEHCDGRGTTGSRTSPNEEDPSS